MLSFESDLSVASRRRLGPMSSWLDLRLEWRLPKKPKKHNKSFPLKTVSLSFFPRPKPVNPTTPSAPLKIQKLTRAEMAERQLKGLCYNCDDKYFSDHKCKEQNLFMAISEDIQEEDDDTSPVPESPETSKINPLLKRNPSFPSMLSPTSLPPKLSS
jgi:hypothetical protein